MKSVRAAIFLWPMFTGPLLLWGGGGSSQKANSLFASYSSFLED